MSAAAALPLLASEIARRRGGRGTEGRVSGRRGAEDFFVTPAWVTEALLEREVFPGPVWEPACGDGAMSRVLEAAGYAVHSTDLVDRGFGFGGVDFLAADPPAPAPQSVVTNPPFARAGEFAVRALAVGMRKVALFGRLGFLEGQRRAAFFARHPPSRIWILARRATLWAGGVVPEGAAGGGRMAFAWFVWERGHPPAAPGWIA